MTVWAISDRSDCAANDVVDVDGMRGERMSSTSWSALGAEGLKGWRHPTGSAAQKSGCDKKVAGHVEEARVNVMITEARIVTFVDVLGGFVGGLTRSGRLGSS